jgi:hypothetical protein
MAALLAVAQRAGAAEGLLVVAKVMEARSAMVTREAAARAKEKEATAMAAAAMEVA